MRATNPRSGGRPLPHGLDFQPEPFLPTPAPRIFPDGHPLRPPGVANSSGEFSPAAHPIQRDSVRPVIPRPESSTVSQRFPPPTPMASPPLPRRGRHQERSVSSYPSTSTTAPRVLPPNPNLRRSQPDGHRGIPIPKIIPPPPLAPSSFTPVPFTAAPPGVGSCLEFLPRRFVPRKVGLPLFVRRSGARTRTALACLEFRPKVFQPRPQLPLMSRKVFETSHGRRRGTIAEAELDALRLRLEAENVRIAESQKVAFGRLHSVSRMRSDSLPGQVDQSGDASQRRRKRKKVRGLLASFKRQRRAKNDPSAIPEPLGGGQCASSDFDALIVAYRMNIFDEAQKKAILKKFASTHRVCCSQIQILWETFMISMTDRARFAKLFGPTVVDRKNLPLLLDGRIQMGGGREWLVIRKHFLS